MESKNILLVTFPVDLGNRTIESNFHTIFSKEMDFYRFAEKHAYDIDYGGVSARKSLLYRIESALALRKIVGKYTKDGKTVVFNGLSPALFSYGSWKAEQTVIVLDWTRKLYPSVLGQPIIKDVVFYLHRQILRSCPKILFGTDALFDNLHDIYGLDKSFLFKVPVPFLVEKLKIPPRPTPKKPRVLFVGGDLKRKGGHLLLAYWKSKLQSKCVLTMMTNDISAKMEGVRFMPDIKYGSKIHRRIFKEHDILILPTKIDSYPQVIGEAAAAGLVVITTKYALASKEVIIDGITGYISDTPEECLYRLEYLLSKPLLIDAFKQKGYEFVHQKFCKDLIRQKYLKIINGNSNKKFSVN